jgi:hypothetical protein
MSSLSNLIRCLGLALALLVVVPVDEAEAIPQSTPTSSALHRAGLVVIHGDGSRTVAVVAFPEDEITGIELLHRSGIDMLSIPFGGLGEGICQLEREGCDVVECRRTVCQTSRDAPFWQLFDRVAADGTLASAPLGGSATRIRDGEVAVWAWTGTDLDLPAFRLDEVAAESGLAGDEWATFGAGERTAVINSGYASVSDEPIGLMSGALGLLLVVLAGAAILVTRRVRAAR